MSIDCMFLDLQQRLPDAILYLDVLMIRVLALYHNSELRFVCTILVPFINVQPGRRLSLFLRILLFIEAITKLFLFIRGIPETKGERRRILAK